MFAPFLTPAILSEHAAEAENCTVRARCPWDRGHPARKGCHRQCASHAGRETAGSAAGDSVKKQRRRVVRRRLTSRNRRVGTSGGYGAPVRNHLEPRTPTLRVGA